VRIVAYVDGFNLYHAIAELGEPSLKWLDLRGLCERFVPHSDPDSLKSVYYYSAFATWRHSAHKRHRQYVKALEANGVTCVLARFKPKPLDCHRCGHQWTHHEEKETDVRLALGLVMGAVKDEYDRALLVTADSDLVPAVRLVRREHPKKDIRIVTPPGRDPCEALVMAAGGKRQGRCIGRDHLLKCLLPPEVVDPDGTVVARRPSEYAP